MGDSHDDEQYEQALKKCVIEVIILSLFALLSSCAFRSWYVSQAFSHFCPLYLPSLEFCLLIVVSSYVEYLWDTVRTTSPRHDRLKA